jgi:hypothetical protein
MGALPLMHHGSFGPLPPAYIGSKAINFPRNDSPRGQDAMGIPLRQQPFGRDGAQPPLCNLRDK